MLCIEWFCDYFVLIEQDKSTFKISSGKPIGKRLPWSPRRRWECNIRMYLKGMGTRKFVDSAQKMYY